MKTKNFFKTNKEYFITSLIILMVFIALYAVFSAFPFGTNTIAHYDMIAQIIPISETIFDFLKGESPLFYSESFLAGANTFGYLIYFILSPFNLLLLLGGEGNLYFSINIVFVLKLVTICCTAIWFIKKYFPKLNTINIIILSLSYTFCGYMFMMYTFLSFLDYLIYTPLLVHFFIKMKSNGNIIPVAIIIFCMILSCFYVGSFSLLYIFILFGAYVFIVEKKEDRHFVISRTLIATFWGIVMALPILLPSLITFLNSGRNIGNSINLNTTNYSIIPSLALTTIAEGVTIIFAVSFLIKCDKKEPLNKFLIFSSFLTLLTIFCTEILINFNAGSIYGYYSRFGFVGAFLTLILASKYLETYTAKEKISKTFTWFSYIFCIVFMVITIVCTIIVAPQLSEELAYQYAPLTYFCAWLALAILTILPVIISLIINSYIGKHFLTICLITTLCLVGLNSTTFFSGGILPTDEYYAIKTMVSEQNLEKQDRIKVFSSDYYSFNQTTYGVSSIQSFSSLADSNSLRGMANLGYQSSNTNCLSFSGTILSDLVVNNRHYIYPYAVDRPYLRFLDSKNGLYLYENTYFKTPILSLFKEVEISDNLAKTQQSIFEALGGQGELLQKIELDYDLDGVKHNVEIKDNKLIPTKTSYDCFIDYSSIVQDENTLLYLYFKTNNEPKYLYLNDCTITYDCFVELNTNPDDNKLYLQDKIDLNSLEFYILDLDLIYNLVETQCQNFMNETNYYSVDYNKISTTVNLSNPTTIIIPFSNINGYTVYVNGEKNEFSNKFLSFLTLDLPEGESNIEIVFNNPIYKYILLAVIIGSVLFVIGILIYKYIEKINKNFIVVTFGIILLLFLIYFISYPATTSILKLIMLICK